MLYQNIGMLLVTALTVQFSSSAFAEDQLVNRLVPMDQGALGVVSEVAFMHCPVPHDLQFSPDGSVLFSCSDTVRMWNTKNGSLIGVLRGPSPFSMFALAQSGRLVITLDDSQLIEPYSYSFDVPLCAAKIRVWDAITQKELRSAVVPLPSSPDHLAVLGLSVDETESRLAVYCTWGGWHGQHPAQDLLYIGDLNTLEWTKLSIPAHGSGSSGGIPWYRHPDNMVYYNDGEMTCLNPGTGDIQWKCVPEDFSFETLHAVNWMPDRPTQMLCLTGSDCRLFDSVSGELTHKAELKSCVFSASEPSPDGGSFLMASSEFGVLEEVLVNFRIGSVTTRTIANLINDMPLSKAAMWGRHITSENNQVRMLHSGPVAREKPGGLCVSCLIFDRPTQQKVHSTGTPPVLEKPYADYDPSLYVYNTAEARIHKQSIGDYMAVSIGQSVAAGLSWNTVHVVGEGDPIKFNGPSFELRCVAISVDGRICAAGGETANVELWDVETHALLTCLKGPVSPINEIILSRENDRNVILASDLNGSLWKWTERPLKKGEYDCIELHHAVLPNKIDQPMHEITGSRRRSIPSAISRSGQRYAVFHLASLNAFKPQIANPPFGMYIRNPLMQDDGELVHTSYLDGNIFENKEFLVGQLILVDTISQESKTFMPSLLEDPLLTHLKYSPDGELLALAFRRRDVRIFDSNQTLTAVIPIGDEDVADIALDFKKSLLFVARVNGGVDIYNLDTLSKVQNVNVLDATIAAIDVCEHRGKFKIGIATRDTGLIVKTITVNEP